MQTFTYQNLSLAALQNGILSTEVFACLHSLTWYIGKGLHTENVCLRLLPEIQSSFLCVIRGKVLFL
jgi:hypothetical protein